MCGIVGVAGNTFQRDMKIFRDMLVFDQVRGFDSTGVCAVAHNKTEPVVEKDLDGPDNLWNYGGSQIFDQRGIARISNKVMIGHNRAATIGNIIKDNAHPFTFDHITGVHNGSLDMWWELEGDDYGKEFDVDSKALIKTIAVRGIDDAWKSFHGAASLVWWDAKEETLNFIRNDQRPMYFGWNEAGNMLLWASEPWMIRTAAERHSLKLKVYSDTIKNDKGEDIKRTYTTYATKTDHLIKYKVSATNVEMVEVRELEKKVRKATPVTTNLTASTAQSGTTTGGKRGLLHGSDKVNGTWAKGLKKADKDLVGKVFKFSHPVYNVSSKGPATPYFVGEMEGTKMRIEIYPKTMDEYWDFYDENKFFKHSYVIGCRPRIITSAAGHLFGYAIEVNNIRYLPDNVVPLVMPNKDDDEEKLYATIGGRKVDEDTWRDNMRMLGGCCDFCGTGISLDDANNCLWYSQGVICPSCKEDESYKAYMNVRY